MDATGSIIGIDSEGYTVAQTSHTQRVSPDRYAESVGENHLLYSCSAGV